MKNKKYFEVMFSKTIIPLLTVIVVSVFTGSLGAQSRSKDEIVQLMTGKWDITSIDSLSGETSLVDYQKFALSHNPQIRAAYAQWQAAVKTIAVVRGLPDPKINFGYFIQNIETAVGPQEWKIGIMQMIPWLGKLRVQGDIQALKAEAAFQKLQNAIEDVLFRLRITYYDFYYLERAIDITRQNMDLVKNWENVILSKYKTGTARHANLIKTQIEVIKLKDDLETLLTRRRPLLAKFRALLNLSDLDRIHVPDSLAYHAVTYTKEDVTSIVLETNPDLKQLLSMQQAAGKTVTRAKLNYLPDFTIGVDKIFTGDRWNATGQMVPESGKDPLVVMGSLSIPVWFYKQSAGVGAAKNLERKAEAVTKNKENMLQAELEAIWFELDDAVRKVVLYKDLLIPKSLESLRSSEKAYIGDEADFLNLIDAQRRYLQFMLASERALVNHYKVRARLEALAGRKL